MARRPRGRTLTAVPGVRVGWAEEPALHSGVTVVRFDRPAPTVIDVRGPASATFDTHSLGLEATFGRRDALFLAGGSLFGLDAARGVRTSLLLSGRGEGAFGSDFPLPRVSGAALYDLPRRLAPLPEYLSLGFDAASRAGRGPVATGPLGAGTGARVCKYLGRAGSLPGGQASVSVGAGRGATIGLLIVFNSVGAVFDPIDHRWLALARDRRGRPVAPSTGRIGPRERGTTLAVLVTDAPLDRRSLYALAERAHDGIARAVWPAHTATEGDLVFASSTAREDASRPPEARPGATVDRLGGLAERLVALAARSLFAPGALSPGR